MTKSDTAGFSKKQVILFYSKLKYFRDKEAFQNSAMDKCVFQTLNSARIFTKIFGQFSIAYNLAILFLYKL